jgi:hypothetical protein
MQKGKRETPSYAGLEEIISGPWEEILASLPSSSSPGTRLKPFGKHGLQSRVIQVDIAVVYTNVTIISSLACE